MVGHWKQPQLMNSDIYVFLSRLIIYLWCRLDGLISPVYVRKASEFKVEEYCNEHLLLYQNEVLNWYFCKSSFVTCGAKLSATTGTWRYNEIRYWLPICGRCCCGQSKRSFRPFYLFATMTTLSETRILRRTVESKVYSEETLQFSFHHYFLILYT